VGVRKVNSLGGCRQRGMGGQGKRGEYGERDHGGITRRGEGEGEYRKRGIQDGVLSKSLNPTEP